jgi:agmatine deiminase
VTAASMPTPRSSADISARKRAAVPAARRFPAEWEPHTATWIAWPHHEPDWPAKLDAIHWVYAEIARVLAAHEPVRILCPDDEVLGHAQSCLAAHGVTANVQLHVVPTDRVWLRDSAPTAVMHPDGSIELVSWDFNAWAKYDNYALDHEVGAAIARLSGLPRVQARRPDGPPLVLEGGAIDTDGQGTLMVTEECLLSDAQARNPGMTRADYEHAFHEWLGVHKTIWLGEGCVGDDTHGHVDDIARFAGRDVVLLAYEEDPADENHRRSKDNLARLQAAGGRKGDFTVIKMPYPRPVMMHGERLPASYANFYIANGVVIMPTFNDANDRVALNMLSEILPEHQVVGIHAVDLVWGLGTLHCLTQQQTRAR